MSKGPHIQELLFIIWFILLLLYHNYLSLDLNRIAICGLLSANILIFSNILKFPNRSKLRQAQDRLFNDKQLV